MANYTNPRENAPKFKTLAISGNPFLTKKL